MRAVRAQILVLLAVLAVVLTAGASAKDQYFCRMTGHVVESCCCKTDAATPNTSKTAEIRVANCCERIVAATRGATPGAQESLGKGTAPSLAAAIPELFRTSASLNTGTSSAEYTHAPLAIGPPLFIVHCALLS